jgi:uracil-DNA glycosylase family 4
MEGKLSELEAKIVRCRACARLVAHRERVAREKRRAYRDAVYWGRPVPACGSARARLVIVGLAPGAHGSNRTGRMFTGDSSGDTLFAHLHAFGFASQPRAFARDDGLRLRDCFITAAVRCAPPGNRPTTGEFAACRPFLVAELQRLSRARVFLALGRMAHAALLRALPAAGVPLPERTVAFRHGARLQLFPAGPWLACCYHPSRQNTQTGRLTAAMLHEVFGGIRRLLDEPAGGRARRRGTRA